MTNINKGAIINILVDRIAFLEQAYCQQEWRLESARIKAERRLQEIRRQEAVIQKRNREIAALEERVIGLTLALPDLPIQGRVENVRLVPYAADVELDDRLESLLVRDDL